MSVIVKALQFAEQRRVVTLGHARLTREPGEDLLIGKLHKGFETLKLVLLEARELGVSEPPHEQIHFANAAVPSAKAQPPQANLDVRMHESWAFWMQLGDLPRHADALYIAGLAGHVIGRGHA